MEHVALRHKEWDDFVKFGSFLTARNSKSNEAINIINEISLDHVSRFDIGFIMGERKIDISKEALDEIESQTGLVLERETRYYLYECFMKTSVVRYQKLNNGARSMFDSKRISRDSGIVEDGTEDSNIYRNPDFERQEIYAKLENVIKNPEKIRSCRPTISNVKTKQVKINETKNAVYDDDEYDYAKDFPMDKYGSAWGSYYHDHPYIGRCEGNDNTRYATTSFSNTTRPITTSDGNNERVPFLLAKLRRRKKDKKSFHSYGIPYEEQDLLPIIEEDNYFDPYGGYFEVPPSNRFNRFFQRTKTLRNIRMFWQQILCTIFIILGKISSIGHTNYTSYYMLE